MAKSYKEEKFIKYCLAEALLKLMQTNSISEITVNEICNEAHVTRPTYYHYTSPKQGKPELIEFKIKRDWDKFIESNPDEPKKDGGNLLNFIYNNRDIFHLCYINGLVNVMISWLYYANDLSLEKGPNGYLNYYTVYGYLGIMTYWDLNGYTESPKEINKIFRKRYTEIFVHVINDKRKKKSETTAPPPAASLPQEKRPKNL